METKDFTGTFSRTELTVKLSIVGSTDGELLCSSDISTVKGVSSY